MKKTVLTVLFAVFVMVAANAQKIDGKWKTSIDTPDGAIELTYNFKTDGEKLTGFIATDFGDMPFTNGKISGNEFSYVMDMMGEQKGKIEGDVIKIVMDSFDGQKMELTLKKVE